MTTALKCLEQASSNCEGVVEFRESLSGTGLAIERCDHHWNLRLQKQEDHRQDYPDSSNPPTWFDPTYAGERWNEDD